MVRMLGPLEVLRNGAPIDLPPSRKVRGLLAYLAVSPGWVGRSRLCDLFWDVPSDPRGELRWCLSKLRLLLDEPSGPRVLSQGDMVALRLDGCNVDVETVANAATDLDALDTARLQELAELFQGEFLDGLELERSPHFGSWVVAQRRRFNAIRSAILTRLCDRLPAGSPEQARCLEQRVELSPFDLQAQCALLSALAAAGQVDAGEAHLAATLRLFSSEGLNGAVLRSAWEGAKHARPAPARAEAVVTPADSQAEPSQGGQRERASLAVMPFREELNVAGARGGLADGLTHDIITRLAKLRDLFIIARGSVFALSELDIGPEEAGRRLNVDYVASGTVRHHGDRIAVLTELIEVKSSRILWTDEFVQSRDNIFATLDEVGNRIVSSISAEVEVAERNRAILMTPNSLNAWEAYHRGLWHMYRFTRPENELAQRFFALSVKLDPTFARAYAGLSFTHWQNAFQRWGDRERETDLAYDTAGRSLLSDDHNPAAHWAMGRALWLRGREDQALAELTRAVDLSPNFALGHYALSFVQSQSGDPAAAIGAADQSRHLSPFDPLMFGMLGARAMAHVRLGQFEEAAEWALKAAARPNSHAIILAIAAHCLGLAGREEEGRAISATLHKTHPHYRVEDFLSTFRFAPDAAALFRLGAKRVGLG